MLFDGTVEFTGIINDCRHTLSHCDAYMTLKTDYSYQLRTSVFQTIQVERVNSMQQSQGNSQPGNGVAIVNLVMMAIFIGSVFTGFSRSDKIHGRSELSADNLVHWIGRGFQFQTSAHGILPKKAVVNPGARKADLAKTTTVEQAPPRNTLDSRARAMLGMFVVMLRNG